MKTSYVFNNITTLVLDRKTKQYNLINQRERFGKIVKTALNEVSIMFNRDIDLTYIISFENEAKEDDETVIIWECIDSLGKECIFMIKEHSGQIHLQTDKSDLEDMFKTITIYLLNS